MKQFRWQVRFGLALLALSALLFGITYALTGDLRSIGTWFLQSLAFMPLEVLLVTIILSELLRITERRKLQEKMNVLIGIFFSEVGAQLLQLLLRFDPEAQKLQPGLQLAANWSDRNFTNARAFLFTQDFHIDSQHGDLVALRSLLLPEKRWILQLLESPILAEFEGFTNLIWALIHLIEELAFRRDLTQLALPDSQHLSLDIQRVYVPLIGAWLEYMKHLSRHYPYLYSLAIRTNPFA
ncbi:MAG: hypothetical protein WCP58_06755 [bacterium]